MSHLNMDEKSVSCLFSYISWHERCGYRQKGDSRAVQTNPLLNLILITEMKWAGTFTENNDMLTNKQRWKFQFNLLQIVLSKSVAWNNNWGQQMLFILGFHPKFVSSIMQQSSLLTTCFRRFLWKIKGNLFALGIISCTRACCQHFQSKEKLFILYNNLI